MDNYAIPRTPAVCTAVAKWKSLLKGPVIIEDIDKETENGDDASKVEKDKNSDVANKEHPADRPEGPEFEDVSFKENANGGNASKIRGTDGQTGEVNGDQKESTNGDNASKVGAKNGQTTEVHGDLKASTNVANSSNVGAKVGQTSEVAGDGQTREVNDDCKENTNGGNASKIGSKDGLTSEVDGDIKGNANGDNVSKIGCKDGQTSEVDGDLTVNASGNNVSKVGCKGGQKDEIDDDIKENANGDIVSQIESTDGLTSEVDCDLKVNVSDGNVCIIGVTKDQTCAVDGSSNKQNFEDYRKTMGDKKKPGKGTNVRFDNRQRNNKMKKPGTEDSPVDIANGKKERVTKAAVGKQKVVMPANGMPGKRVKVIRKVNRNAPVHGSKGKPGEKDAIQNCKPTKEPQRGMPQRAAPKAARPTRDPSVKADAQNCKIKKCNIDNKKQNPKTNLQNSDENKESCEPLMEKQSEDVQGAPNQATETSKAEETVTNERQSSAVKVARPESALVYGQIVARDEIVTVDKRVEKEFKEHVWIAAIPCMPIYLAVICCILNIFAPGIGM